MPYKDTERYRQYQREYRHKRRREDPDFIQQERNACKRWLQNLPSEKREHLRYRRRRNSREFRQAHPDSPKRYYRKNKMEWTNGIDCRKREIWRTAEKKAAQLAESLGFTDIFEPDFKYFYYDFLARKDGHIAIFQVTTLRSRQLKRKHLELAQYLGCDFYIIHVKPTLDVAYITPIVTDPLPDSEKVTYHYAKGKEHPLP